jgi:hypothetical protein
MSHFFFGTFLPALRALESPIAIACFLLVTFLPLLPLRNLPSFLAFISVSTLFPADFEYLRFDAFWAVDFLVVMGSSCRWMMCNIGLLHGGPVSSVMLPSLDSETREIVESYCPNDLRQHFAYERTDSDEWSRAESRLQAKRR